MRLVADVAAAHHEGHVVVDGGLDLAHERLEVVEALGMGAHGQLHAAHHVEHADVVQAVHAPGDGELHAAHDGVVARVDERHAAAGEGLDVHLVVEALRQAIAQADDLGRLAEQRVGRARMQAHAQVGLRQTRVPLEVEQQERELVRGVATLGVHAAHNEVVARGEAREEAGAVRGAHEDDRVGLEVEALQKLADLRLRGAGRHARAVVRQQVLIHAPQGDGARV